jgi:methionine synthase I (cobalamin-dependent)
MMEMSGIQQHKKTDILALVRERTVVLDGAMGTMLMVEGLGGGEVPEAWNLDKPHVIQSIHRRYFEAGADVVLTNTFGGNRLKLEKKKKDREVLRINTRAAELARAVAPPGKFVAGDIGPSGELIAPVGSYSSQELEEVFEEQAHGLMTGGVDLIIIETMFSLQEALTALKGARRAGDGPVFVCITYERKGDMFVTMMGETPEDCVKTLEQEGADGIGANCTIKSDDMIPLAAILRSLTNLPVVVEPNAGAPRIKDGITVYTQKPDEFADDVEVMVRHGVNMVGGCCGTTPEFISAIHARLAVSSEAQ